MVAQERWAQVSGCAQWMRCRSADACLAMALRGGYVVKTDGLRKEGQTKQRTQFLLLVCVLSCPGITRKSDKYATANWRPHTQAAVRSFVSYHTPLYSCISIEQERKGQDNRRKHRVHCYSITLRHIRTSPSNCFSFIITSTWCRHDYWFLGAFSSLWWLHFRWIQLLRVLLSSTIDRVRVITKLWGLLV